ncbi:hypothetical protein KFU94_23540 [Chloroflexi bacterium TSY]|nr:hypothetical protein [Chloroflexi bacterium TSY]
MSHQNDKAEKTKESRSSALNGQVTPLALSFDTEVSSGFLESDFNGPAFDEISDDVGGQPDECRWRSKRRSQLGLWDRGLKPSAEGAG